MMHHPFTSSLCGGSSSPPLAELVMLRFSHAARWCDCLAGTQRAVATNVQADALILRSFLRTQEKRLLESQLLLVLLLR